MIRPEDLQNRVVRRSPLVREVLEGEEPTGEETPAAPAVEPCTPGTPAGDEHGERKGGNPECGRDA